LALVSNMLGMASTPLSRSAVIGLT